LTALDYKYKTSPFLEVIYTSRLILQRKVELKAK